MEIAHHLLGNTCTIDVNGDFAIAETQELQTFIQPMLKDETINVFILNFENVDSVDSSGIGLTIFLNKTLEKRGAVLMLCQMNPYVQEAYKLTGLPALIPTFDTLEEAMKEASSY